MARGASSRSGPAPDPNALRRERDGGDWITLDPDGRKGEKAPIWPLTKASKRETELWDREWRRPQAVQWALNGQELEVALYVRALAGAEKPGAPVNLQTLVKQQQEVLGISLPGLARNRWRIGTPGIAVPARRVAAGEARKRFTVITGDG